MPIDITRTPSAAALGLPMATPAVAGESATIELGALNDRGASGTAEVTFDGNMLTVSVNTSGVVRPAARAAHPHRRREHLPDDAG